MRQKDLFKLALGLEDPWMAREVRFDLGEGRLDIWLDFPRGAPSPAPAAGKAARRPTTLRRRPGGTSTSSSTAPISMPVCPAWNAPPAG